jgi:hypothetical protein
VGPELIEKDAHKKKRKKVFIEVMGAEGHQEQKKQ